MKYEVHVLDKGKEAAPWNWRLLTRSWSLDVAFDNACEAVESDLYRGVVIEELGFVIWDSNGFKQGEGKKLLSASEVEWTLPQDGPPRMNEDDEVVPDGSC